MQKQREYVDSEDEILEAFRYLIAYLFCTSAVLFIFYTSILEYLMLTGLAESLPRSYEKFWQVSGRSWRWRKWRSCSAKARLTRTGWLITTPSVKPFFSKHRGQRGHWTSILDFSFPVKILLHHGFLWGPGRESRSIRKISTDDSSKIWRALEGNKIYNKNSFRD